jgi:hypothetical protein
LAIKYLEFQQKAFVGLIFIFNWVVNHKEEKGEEKKEEEKGERDVSRVIKGLFLFLTIK